ncbi:MAG TPA: tetratricopeptide repeat protein, partial [Thermoanaerobaculia bacterium]|nr:tetratricopeptide repeat protein [Thermoanaerobaculia bacterium]
HGGQVLVSAAARDGAGPEPRDGITLVDLGLHRLRDLTEPERVFQLQHPELPTHFPPLRSMEAFRHNLPVQLTTFIGRDRELVQLMALVRERHLMTLVGAGGSGKTRLALQLAAELLDDFEDGCWFVDLAPLADPALVPLAAAQVLEVREEPGRPLLATFAERVGGKRLLLVLDNCEHVVQAAAEVAEALVRRAPGLRLVATSREPLAIPGELAWPVPSLSLPDVAHLPSAEEIFDFEAVRLFCDRAATVRPGFAPGTADGPAIARICSRLDGIPLAIELAAARIRVLAPKEILSRLEDRFRLLTGGSRVLSRHQTLQAAVEWSHQLLTDAERVLFRRLAPLAGSFDLAAAERVGAGEPLEEADILDLLSHLVDKSLLMADESEEGSVRYRFLETLRQYAAERLEESGEAGAVQGRHLAHFRDLAERAYAERVEAEAEWLARLERDHDDLRIALAWARDHQPADHLRLAGALGWFWQLHGHLSEGRTHLAAALSGPRDPSPELARALWSAGTLAGWQGDADAARSLLEEGRAMYEALGDRLGVALCRESLGWAVILRGDSAAALRYFEEGLRIQQELGNPRLIELAKVAVCQALVAVGDVAQAEPMAKEILAVALEAGDARNTHFAYHFWADCCLYREEGTEAERLYAESLRAALAYGDEAEATFEVEGVGMSGACRGRAQRALRLGGAVEARREELGVSWSLGFWDEFRARFFGRAREVLGPEESAAAWAEGRSMGWEAAVEEALAGSGLKPVS